MHKQFNMLVAVSAVLDTSALCDGRMQRVTNWCLRSFLQQACCLRLYRLSEGAVQQASSLDEYVWLSGRRTRPVTDCYLRRILQQTFSCRMVGYPRP